MAGCGSKAMTMWVEVKCRKKRGGGGCGSGATGDVLQFFFYSFWMGSVTPFEEILSRICILLKMIGEEWNIAVADMQKHVANIVSVLYVGCYWRKQSKVYDSFSIQLDSCPSWSIQSFWSVKLCSICLDSNN
ncbi:unnamed protein product [Musa banksii]